MSEPSPAHIPDHRPPATVLIVEDDPDCAAVVGEFLQTQDEWLVSVVDTLQAALDAVQNQDWDLMFLDINLPDSKGLDTFFKICDKAPQTSIVVMTGESEKNQARRALQAGAQDFLTKGSFTSAAIDRIAHFSLERGRLDRKLRNSHQLLASTLDTMPAYVAILEVDGQIRAINSRWRHYDNPGNPLIYGCKLGDNYLAVCDTAMGNSGNLPSVALGILQVTAGIKDRFTEDYSVPAFTGRSWFEISATRFNDKEGKTTVVISQIDISERKELENQLRASQELFTLISENVVDLMAIIDHKGERIYTSPSYSTLLGYSTEELKSLKGRDLLHLDDIEKVEESIAQLVKSEKSNLMEFRLRHKNGHYLHFESRGSLIPSHETGESRALIVARDVTSRYLAEQERIQMEAHLRQAQKLEAIGQLAAGIAHEINTPTQYIGDNLLFLQDSARELCNLVDKTEQALSDSAAFDPENLKKWIEDADYDYLKTEIPKAIQQSIEGVKRVSKIVSAMKDFSHPSGDSKERVDLNRAIESTSTVSRNEWKYLAELDLDLEPNLPMVPCFPSEFNQVILNLIVNAAHAIGEAKAKTGNDALGKIRIQTKKINDKIEIRISDTGTGIPEKHRDRLFEPFFTTKPVGKGTGQGLPIARSVIVDKHGGKLYFETEMGVGTTFIIELPIEP